MGNPLRDGRPVGARDHRSGPAFEAWKIERQAEIDAEKAAQDAAAANDPVAIYAATANAEAQAIRELVLTVYVPDSILPGVERIGGMKVIEEPAIRNWKHFADTCSTFQRWMARPLLDAAERSDIAPIASNYLALHNLMLQYSAYPEPPAQPVVTETQVEVPVLTPSEQAVIDHQRYLEEIVGIDELGTQYTEAMLDELPSKQALRLRRLFESGHRGSNLLTVRREILDIKQVQDAERERIAAEQEGGN
jgi:hypothetical protein